MNLTLWIVTILLAIAFAAAGLIKITGTREQLRQRMPWTEDYSPAQVKGIGAIELLGALGLVLPAVTGFGPILVPLAATGLAIAMVLAATVHVRRGDGVAAAIPSVVLALLCFVVAWGRFGPYAF